MKVRFYGSSDDNFCWDIDGKPTDEIGCYGSAAKARLSNGIIVEGE